MFSLLKIDLKRVLNDKLFLVLIILAVVFAVITPLLYEMLFVLLEAEEFAGMMIDGKTIFFSSFSAGNNLGLIAPVLIMIVLCKDFSYGTIRNKIISGNKRAQIFVSLFITCFVITWGIVLVQALLSLGVSLLFFEYQSTAFTSADFWYFIISLVLQMLIWLFVCALMSFFCVFMKNAGLAVVMYVAVVLLMGIFGAIVQVAFMFADAADKILYNVLEFLNGSNPFLNYIGFGTEYKLKEVLYMAIPCVLWTGLLLVLGALAFNKKDLK